MGAYAAPPIRNYEELANYTPLQVDAWNRFDRGREMMKMFPDRYHMADFILSGFTIMSFIRGIEDFFVDMYEDREGVEHLADIVFGAEEELIRACAKEGFDAICLADDLGNQRNLFFSLDMFREIFKPRFQHEFDLAHSLGLDVYMHSCGKIIDVIPELIDVGLDVLNPGQPKDNGIDLLGQRFGGKLCFSCPTNYQTTGISGTAEEVENEIRAYVEHLSSPKGGLIGLVAIADLGSLGASPELRKATLNAWNTYCGSDNPY